VLLWCFCLRSCTTSQIDKQLPEESAVAWRNRSSVDHVVLLDWRCSAVNLDPRGSIACLRDALVKVRLLCQGRFIFVTAKGGCAFADVKYLFICLADENISKL